MGNFFKVSLMTILLSFVSCTEVDFDYCVNYPYVVIPTYVAPGTTNAQGQYAIAFGGYSNGQTRASVNSESNTGYDDFTLYAWTNDSVVLDKYHTKYVANEGWTYVGVDGQKLKYFDNFVDAYSFIGVIPQTTSSISNGVVTTEVEAFTVDNETTTDTPKEFLYSTTSVAKTDYANGVTMNFKHGNAKVQFAFTSNDANTEIIDYYPSVQGATMYQVKANPTEYYGPKESDLKSAGVTDEDIEFINSKFDFYAPHGYNWIPTTQKWAEINPEDKHWFGTTLISYWSTNLGDGNAPVANSQDVYTQFSGDLSFNAWEYLASKYPTLADINIENWSTAVNGVMKLVHIEKEAIANSTDYRMYAYFINPANVTQTVIGTTQGTQGVEDIVLIPTISAKGNGSDAVLATYPTVADANISLNGVSYDVTSTSKIVKLTKPTTKITSNDTDNPIMSPTTWYTLPCNAANVGYTLKFSYTYKGKNVYDARVFIPANECNWQEGKFYKYVIKINGKGNGKTDPTNLEADDPVVEQTNSIKLFLVEFTSYELGGDTVVKEIY